MSDSFTRSKSHPKNYFGQLSRLGLHSKIRSSRVAAAILLLLSVTFAILAYASTLSPGTLAFRVDTCQLTLCVSWVMPAGLGWDQGARPGMEILSVNGTPLSDYRFDYFPVEPIRTAQLRGNSSEMVTMEVVEHPIGKSPMKFSLWALGGMFALLGSAVIVRRPDLNAARSFWVFSSLTALALVVAPSAGGPMVPWSLIIQFLTLLGLAAALPLFVIDLVYGPQGSQRRLVICVASASAIALFAGYIVSVLLQPLLYQAIRPMLIIYLSFAVLGSIVLLGLHAIGQFPTPKRQQARAALFGTASGTLPFVTLTLVPLFLDLEPLMPNYITVLFWGLIPIAFAYSILQYQLMGIRRLVHRGMAYGIAGFILLALLTSALTLIAPSLDFVDSEYRTLVLGWILIGAILVFFPLHHGTRWIVDKLLYSEVVDYHTFLRTVRDNVFSSSHTSDVSDAIVHRLRDALRLESAILLLGSTPERTEVVAKSGEKAGAVLQNLTPYIVSHFKELIDPGMFELQYESDSFLVSGLDTGAKFVGYMILGPKEGGEVFIADQRRLVATVSPILAIAIDKSQLSEDLRELNQRLVQAGENERGRIAGDVHDGPLQRALLIIRENEGGSEAIDQLARQIVNDLREIASRLRPSILDDLGVVPSLDWLLDDVSKRSTLQTHLSIKGIDEEERFGPDVELAIFRIAQEATNNATKHSEGTSVEISLSKTDHELVLEVADNGKGLSTIVSKPGGFGLTGMRERVVQLGGQLEVTSQPDVGTTVGAHIPIGR